MKSQRLIALFFFGLTLFSYPIINLFGYEGKVAGIPVLYLYIFVAWLLIIVLMALMAEYFSDIHSNE
ncbi:MAG TPA: hypothetical protein PLL64_01615 [Rhodothermales bacterium]|nr:hypothetical protein [Bacteroidota bacterium]HRK72944.1 hypothetical protein [Rhodothermales bacterium]HRR09139.1 hypothetical protein [Rhodothermales bacterium]